MSRHLALIITILCFLTTAACTSAPAPTATPTEIPIETPPPTATLLPEPTPLPSVLELTRASDPSQQVFLSVVHAADAPIFDVYIERLAIATNLSFGQATQPSGIVAGEYFLRVVPNGVRPDAGEILYEMQLQLTAGASLIFVFTGPADELTMTTFPRQLEALDSDQSRITVIHAMPGTPAISVRQDNTVLSAQLAFGSAAFPFTLPAGPASLTFYTESGPLITQDINLLERFSYTMVLAGTPENPTVIETRSSVAGNAHVRFVNASSSIGPVDIYINGEPHQTGLEYTRISERQTRTAQVYSLDVYAAGADTSVVDPLLSQQIIANNDDYITLLLMGTAQDLRLVPYREDVSQTPADEARVAFVNTLPEVPRVRIDTQSRLLTEAGDIGYAQQPRPVELPSGTYLFAWMTAENDEDTELVELVEDVELQQGYNYIYLLTGRIDEPPIILGDNVGFDATQVDQDENAITSPTPEVPTRIRFVNAIKGGLPLEILVDNQPVLTGLAYGNTSAASNINDDEHNISIRFEGTAGIITSSEFILDPGVPYTLVAYGFGTEPVELMLIDDSKITTGGNSPTLRLINLSVQNETPMGLAHSVTEPQEEAPNPFSESPQSETFRRSMAFGIERNVHISDLAGRTASDVALSPLGWHDLHIVDDRLNEIAASIRGIDLQPGQHYDIFAYENLGSMLIEAFVVRYPPG